MTDPSHSEHILWRTLLMVLDIWRRKIFGRMSQRQFLFRAKYSVLAVCVGYILYATFYHADTLVVVTATTETLGYQVEAPEYAKIALNGGLIASGSGSDADRTCRYGYFTPEPHVRVTVVQQTSDALRVIVTPLRDAAAKPGEEYQGRAGTFHGTAGPGHDGDALDTPFTGPVTITMGNLKGCVVQGPVRVPVAGPAVLGQEFGPSANYAGRRPVLLSGTLKMYGRASLAWPALERYGFGSSLYGGGSDFVLPAGSRLRECEKKSQSDQEDERRAWWGFAEAKLDSAAQPAALSAYLTTNADTLAISTSGGQNADLKSAQFCTGEQGRGSAVDIVRVSLLSRFMGDPYITLAWAIMGFLFLLLQMAAAFLPLNDKEREPTT